MLKVVVTRGLTVKKKPNKISSIFAKMISPEGTVINNYTQGDPRTTRNNIMENKEQDPGKNIMDYYVYS